MDSTTRQRMEGWMDGWMDGELYGRHENNSPKDGELNGRHGNNSPQVMDDRKTTHKRDGRMES